jgi:hypothetical protein
MTTKSESASRARAIRRGTQSLTQTHTTLVAVVDDAADRRRQAIELTNGIRQDFKQATKLFWGIGQKLEVVLERKLFTELGYTRFLSYRDGELALAATQAYKMVRVVRHFVRADAERLGLECADALIPYAKQLRVDPGLLVRENALVGDKPITVATVRDIRGAARAARAATRARLDRAPAAREKKREAKALLRALRTALAEARLGRPAITVAADGFVVRVSRAAVVKHVRG